MTDLTDPNALQNIINKMQAEINDLKLRVVSFGNAAEAMETIDGMEAADGNVKLSEDGISATDGSYLTVNQWFGLGLPSDSTAGDIYAIVYDETNYCIYVGGSFTQVGNCTATNIAKYDIADKEWSSIGGSLNGIVRCLLLEEGILYAGGDFTNADGISTADRIAAYDTSAGTWASIGGQLSASVMALAIDSGVLIVGGEFINADGIATADRIAVYDIAGAAWGSIGGSLNEIVYGLCVNGDNLIVVGAFTGKAKIYSISGATWATLSAVSTEVGAGLLYAVASSGDDVYMGGAFVGTNVVRIGRYSIENETFTSIGGSLSSSVRCILYHDTDLIVGGSFVDANDISGANCIARYDLQSAEWNSMGGGIAGDAGTVRALALWGNNIFIGGAFNEINSTSTRMIALYVADLKTALDMLNRYCVPIMADGSVVIPGALTFGSLSTASKAQLVPSNGWTPDSNTWTRVSDFVFSVASATPYYAGVKVMWTSNNAPTTRYGTVASVSGTNITIATNDDYKLTNGDTISGFHYSTAEAPSGFPRYFNFATTCTLTGDSSNPAPTINNAQFKFLSNGHYYVFYYLSMTSTVGSGTYRLSLPVTAQSGVGWIVTAFCRDASANARYTGIAQDDSTGKLIFCFPAPASAASPFTWAVNDQIFVSGIVPRA
jgi:hypothetical protein